MITWRGLLGYALLGGLVAIVLYAFYLGVGVLIGLPPDANAGPYAGPHCNPSSRDYFWSMCKDLPQNDAQCSEFGDMDQCESDLKDYWRQQRELTPTPN